MSIHFKLENVSKSFGSVKVLESINLSVAQGESLVVIGPSGTGKSVLLKCILGLIPLDEGKIYINDQLAIDCHKVYKNVIEGVFGMLFQGGALFDSLPLWYNVAFGLIYGQKIEKTVAKSLAIKALEQVGLNADTIYKLPSEISGGMQKRAAFARAVVTHPEILFFDEPTAGLDPIMSSVINDLIEEKVKTKAITSLTITHDMNCLSHVAHKVAMLFDGKIVWQGSKKEFFKTDDAYVYQFRNGLLTGPLLS